MFDEDDYGDDLLRVSEKLVVKSGLRYSESAADKASMTDKQIRDAAKKLMAERGCQLDEELFIEIMMKAYKEALNLETN
jgi:hypothetical protein